MTTYQILYWHDIPVQVRAGGRRDRVSVELPARFAAAVDSAAMAAGLTGTDGYLSGFAWSAAEERDGSPVEVAAAVTAELDAHHTTIDWQATVAAIRKGS
ncbi:MAG TPA: virulence factor [Promineifilum sp.]|nr:virulence factor [Promineifilum sp.]